MLEQRSLKLDLAALALLALVVFLGLALATYHPADAPGASVYPLHAQPHNACGRSGAILAHFLYTGLGLGAYYLVLSMAAFDGVLLLRRTISDPMLRGIGWLASLVGLDALLAMARPGLLPGPVIGPGGYLGATGHGLLSMHFANAGS